MSELPSQFINDVLNNWYLISVFILFQGTLVFILIVLFLEKIATTKKRRLEEALVKEQSFKQAQLILDEARAEAIKIIHLANEKSKDILQNLNDENQILHQEYKDELSKLAKSHLQLIDKSSQSFIESLNSTLESEKATTIAAFGKAHDEANKVATQKISSFMTSLEKSTMDLENEIKQKISQEHNLLHEKLKEYENRSKARLNEQIFQIISKAANASIGRSLSLEDHEDVVISMLNDAFMDSYFK